VPARHHDPVTIAIVGAGNRGADVYARLLTGLPEPARIVAVAEPDRGRRERLAERDGVPSDHLFSSASELFSRPRLADAVVIATPDTQHLEPARQALALGYHLLLEKPIAPTLPEVNELQAAARDAAGTVTVAHVLRYSPFFLAIERLLRDGRIGQLVTVQHTENIGYWHFAHSYVRGNWRREADASPMILAKACHDLDLLRWLVGTSCTSVASYGGRHHFRTENAPEGSTERCSGGCAVERTCPYSALRIYDERFAGASSWPLSVVAEDPAPERLRRALEEGPYGRCVYRCDNDVADHQVVALQFGDSGAKNDVAGGVAATLTVSAFTEENTRTIHLMGTHGEIHGHLGRGEIVLNDFTTGQRLVVPVNGSDDAHGGGDEGIVRDFLARLRGQRTGPAGSDLSASVESHLMAFAAERSRLEGRTVELASLV